MKQPKFGLLLLGNRAPDEFIAVVKRAESAGFETAWVADERFYRDCWAQLGVASQHTSKIGLGTAVTDPYHRHPALTAVSIATVDEMSDRRAILGLGLGGSAFKSLGLEKAHPLTVLREAIELTRELLQGDEVDYRGKAITFQGRLSVAPAPHVPIMIATNGAQVMELAGQIADIVMVQGMADTPMVTAVLEHVDRGARKAGRPRPKLIARLDTCISDDPAAIRRATVPGLTRHLRVHYPGFRSQALAGLQIGDELRAAVGLSSYSFEPQDLEKVAPLIPDEFIDRLCLSGSADQVESRIRKLVAAGVDQITVFPVSARGEMQVQDATIDAFTSRVMPRFA